MSCNVKIFDRSTTGPTQHIPVRLVLLRANFANNTQKRWIGKSLFTLGIFCGSLVLRGNPVAEQSSLRGESYRKKVRGVVRVLQHIYLLLVVPSSRARLATGQAMDPVVQQTDYGARCGDAEHNEHFVFGDN